MNFSTVNSERLMQARRVVLKIGSALFVDQELGVLRHQWLESLCADIVDMREAGKEIIIVSSGAIALGARQLGIDPNHAAVQSRGKPMGAF